MESKKASIYSQAITAVGILFLNLSIFVLGTGQVAAQSLEGPSSAQFELTPGDGITDPQFRFDFPRNIAPRYFDFKDRLAEDHGLSFSVDYLSLGQWTNSQIGPGEAASGMLRFFGNWNVTENGSIGFRIDNRHAYSAVAPQSLGLQSGALAVTGLAFSGVDWIIPNLFWNQSSGDGRWSFQFGQIDATDFLNMYSLASPYTAFQNFAFGPTPTIGAPQAGIGIAGQAMLNSNVYVLASVSDANGDPANPNFDVFKTGELFKSVEIGYTSGYDKIFVDNVHLTFWQSDASQDGNRLEDYGAAFSASWSINNEWAPFLRGGFSQGNVALYKTMLSAGVGYHARNTDLAGVGISTATGSESNDIQLTTEAFYRFTIAPGFQITPSIQFISNPLLTPGQNNMTILGIRTRVAF